jgi:hypothetical protein
MSFEIAVRFHLVDKRHHEPRHARRIGNGLIGAFLGDDGLRCRLGFGLPAVTESERSPQVAIAVAQVLEFHGSLPAGCNPHQRRPHGHQAFKSSDRWRWFFRSLSASISVLRRSATIEPPKIGESE